MINVDSLMGNYAFNCGEMKAAVAHASSDWHTAGHRLWPRGHEFQATESAQWHIRRASDKFRA